MRLFKLAFPALASVLMICSAPVVAAPQQSSSNSTIAPTRSPQAALILQNALRAMGGIVPLDSTAGGSVTTVAGGSTSQGTIQIVTKGLAESSVQFVMPEGTTTTVYANGNASSLVGSTAAYEPLNSAVTDQAAEFPLPLIAALLSDPNTSFEYVGLETVSGQSAYHITAWDSFASKPGWQKLSALSTRDIWINQETGLPEQISFTHSVAQGIAGILMNILYTGYMSSSGILYPSLIEESVNGTPWATITIQNVAFNTGLPDSDFPVPSNAGAGVRQ